MPAPFAACVASSKGSGDEQCPAGFPSKLVAGRPNVSCNASSCACSLNATPCTGTFTFYTDANCTQGAAGVVAEVPGAGALTVIRTSAESTPPLPSLMA